MTSWPSSFFVPCSDFYLFCTSPPEKQPCQPEVVCSTLCPSPYPLPSLKRNPWKWSPKTCGTGSVRTCPSGVPVFPAPTVNPSPVVAPSPIPRPIPRQIHCLIVVSWFLLLNALLIIMHLYWSVAFRVLVRVVLEQNCIIFVGYDVLTGVDFIVFNSFSSVWCLDNTSPSTFYDLFCFWCLNCIH